MAPSTPSPYRFVGGQKRVQTTSTDERSHATSKNAFVRQEQTPSQRDKNSAPSSQFVPAPRFSSAGLTQAISDLTRPSSPYKSSFAQALQGPHRSLEDVEEVQRSQEDEEMLDNGETVNLAPQGHVDGDMTSYGLLNDLPYSPKRRRLDDHAETESDQVSAQQVAKPGFRRPTIPASHLTSHGTPDFNRTQTTTDTLAGESPLLRRPAFLRSSGVHPEGQQSPLPEVFSPHRRGPKFIQGGMAATVQQWVIETGQAAMQSRRNDAFPELHGYTMQIRICELSGSGPYMVRGHHVDGSEVHVMLTESPSSGTHGQNNVQVDVTVGIRAPIVEVDLGESKCFVAVDWRILS